MPKTTRQKREDGLGPGKLSDPGNASGHQLKSDPSNRGDVQTVADPTSPLDQVLRADNEWEIYFINNLVKTTPLESPLAYMICSSLEATEFFERNNTGVKFPKKPKAKGKDGTPNTYAYPAEKDKFKSGAHKEDWAEVTKYFAAKAKKFKPDAEKNKDVTHKNIERLGKVLGLNKAAVNCLLFFFKNANFSAIFDNVSHNLETHKIGLLMARIMGDNQNAVNYTRTMNKEESPLFKYGFLHFFSLNDSFPKWDINMVNRLMSEDMSEEQIVSMLLGAPLETELELEDFDYLGEQLHIGIESLRGALERGEEGVVMFLHGEAGLGKTELAKVIAKHLKKNLYSIGEKNTLSLAGETAADSFDDDDDDFGRKFDDYGAEGAEDRTSRLDQLLRADKLLEDSEDSMILMDEPEDLVANGSDSSKRADPPSKLKLNRAFEKNRRPIIMCGNNPEKFHEAVRSRSCYSIEMRPMPTKVRLKIWKRQIELQQETLGAKIDLTDKEVLSLARKYEAVPRLIRMALQNYIRSGGNKGAIHETIAASSTIVRGNPLAVESGNPLTDDFEPDLINITVGADAVVRLTESVRKGLAAAILLNTKSGYGAEQILHHVAEQAGRHIDEYHATDLMREGQMVPPPAEQIMGAFKAAEATKSLLVIREPQFFADIPDSNGNVPDQAWRHGLAAVFEEAMLKHRGPVAIVMDSKVKLPRHLKALFSDEVVLAPLSQTQIIQAYHTYLGNDRPVPIELGSETDFVVEDFIRTRRRLALTEHSGAVSPQAVLGILRDEREIRLMREVPGGFGFSQATAPGRPQRNDVPTQGLAANGDHEIRLGTPQQG